MYCRNCGTQNPDGARFCKECGTSFDREELNMVFDKRQPEKKSKTVYFIIGGVVILLAVISAIFIGMQSKKTKEYESYLDTADKYVAELDYEQAQEYYLKAIAVAPKKLEPYVKLAEVYMDLGETEAAEQILEKAEEAGAKGKDEIEKLKESIVYNMSAYKLYAEKIYEYEEKYGIAEVKWLNDWYTYVSGLSFIKLIDFDQNGQEELMLVYAYAVDAYDMGFVTYLYDIWGYEDDELVLLEEGEYLFGTDGGMSRIYLTEYEGKTYLVTGGMDAFEEFYYHNYLETGEFGIVRREECEDFFVENPVCTIDGKRVSVEEYEKEHAKWFENVKEYFLNYEDASGTLEENEKTKHKLFPYYRTENKPVEEMEETAKANETVTAQWEIELQQTEEESAELEEKLNNAMSQSDLNQYSGQLYKLWDDEINRLWKHLKNTLGKSEMEELTKIQRKWIKEKEAYIEEAGDEWRGGSGQPMAESLAGYEMTRERVYELAEYMR